MTAVRLTHLIREMKHVCRDLPVMGAALEMQPSHKVKPDKDALERNRELLQEGYDSFEIKHSIDKEENAGMRRRCGYCGVSEKEEGGDGGAVDLSRCPCKTAYYCCPAHQKAHWPEHKDQCKAIRARISG